MVRRYIFERLQASVSPGEGDLEGLKQTISGLQEEVRVRARDVEHVSVTQTQLLDAIHGLRDVTSYLEHVTADVYAHVTGSPPPPPPAPPGGGVAESRDGLIATSSPSHVRHRTFGPLLDNGMQSVIETGDEEAESAS